MTTKVRRRLTTLLCADVEGYTRLMEADEAGTLATLRQCRAAMATLVERHDGRIVNTWGDAVIAEFPSVVEAVQCAVETQQEIFSQNGGLPESRRMRFRIGIHLGDVMVEGDDVYGDGVNIAARLQELAEPGGGPRAGTGGRRERERRKVVAVDPTSRIDLKRTLPDGVVGRKPAKRSCEPKSEDAPPVRPVPPGGGCLSLRTLP